MSKKEAVFLKDWLEFGSPEHLPELLEVGFDVNQEVQKGASPLFYVAAVREGAGMLEALIEAGAEVNKASLKGKTPLMMAAKRSDLAAVQKLLDNGAEIFAEDCEDHNALWFARQSKRRKAPEVALVLMSAE